MSLANYAVPILADTAVKSFILMVVVCCIVACMRRTSAAARHFVWCLAVSGLLLLPFLSAGLPGLIVLPSWMDLTGNAAVSERYDAPRLAPLPPAAGVSDGQPSTGLPAIADASPAPARPLSVTPAKAPSAPLAVPAHSRPPLHWQGLTCVLWLLVASLVLLPVAAGMLSLWYLGLRSRRETQGPWLDLLFRLVESLRLRRRVALLKSDRRQMPMTWGVLRPTLLLPEVSEQWPDDRRRAVLLHELAHAKRWDYLTNLLAQVACALYWFNPLVWFAVGMMVIERERACDDIVLNHGARPSVYAEQILQIAATLHVGRFSFAGAIPMARQSKLEGRLRAILDGSRSRASLSRATVMTVVTLMILVLAPIAMTKPALKRPLKEHVIPIRTAPQILPETTTSATLATTSPTAQRLRPARSINSVWDTPSPVVVVQQDGPASSSADWMIDRLRKRLRTELTTVSASQAAGSPLVGKLVVVYGTPQNPWLSKFKERLPFQYEDGAVTVEGRRFEGAHLRVICTIPNPDDPTQSALLYTAAHDEDLEHINGVFHGPTGWVVADGDRVLGADDIKWSFKGLVAMAAPVARQLISNDSGATMNSAADVPAGRLVPAGSINSATAGAASVAVISQQDPAVQSCGQAMAKHLQGRGVKASTMDDTQAADQSLTGTAVVFYGTPTSAWLSKFKERLPFRYEQDAVLINGQRFEGKRLRVICAIRNPEDSARKALLYTAAHVQDVPGINGLFHGPTEWVVADGTNILGSGSFSAGQLSAEEMSADLDDLTAQLKKYHPSAASALPVALNAAMQRARAETSAPLSRDEFWLVVSRLLSTLHDAHTNAPPASGSALGLPFTWTTEGLIINRDAGELRKGDRIVRLGGKNEEQLLALLSQIVSAETPNWVRHSAERMLTNQEVLRVTGIATRTPVAIVVERQGRELETHVSAATDGREPSKPWVRFEIDEKADLGIFTLDQCTNNDLYRKTVGDFFAEVRRKKITRIAIDLRHNGGGNSSVIDTFFREAGETRQGFWGGMSIEDTGLTGLLKQFGGEKKEPFHGQYYALTSNGTFSSANMFAVVVQDFGIGKLLGEPTGNAPSCYGDIKSFSLPNSGLSYCVSYKTFKRPDPKRDPADCVTPDQIIPLTRRDIAEGRDPVLTYLREHK